MYIPQKTQAGCNRTDVSYIDGDVTTSNFPFCNELPEEATDKEVLSVTEKRLHKWTAMEGLYCGRTIAQAISRRLPTASARVRSQVMWDL
jgi:hypothetical protein